MTRIHDVAIIGCGPVGAGLAIALRAEGLDVVILEKEADIYHLPRAIGMDEEILRRWQGFGLLDEMTAITTPIDGAQFVDVDGNRIMGFDLPPGTVGRTGHPPMSMFYQPDLDRLLRDQAVERGTELRLRTEVVGFEQSAEDVRLDLGDGSRLRARWVVACDGAASPTRKRLGITTIDQGFDQEWIVVDVEYLGDESELRGGATQLCDPSRPGTFVPGHRGHRRWEFQAQPGETLDELADPAKVWELIEPWVTPETANLIRAVGYRFHAVVADRMRVDRVFLAGDSAHQMPPFLGQGLNSGMRDAFNLAWKLGMVARGEAGDAILDTYEAERKPHAAEVVEHAVDVGRLIDSLSGKGGDADEDAGYGGGRPFPAHHGGLFRGEGAWVGEPATQPRGDDGSWGDDRFGPGFAVLVADESLVVPPAWATLGASVVRVEAEEIGGHRCSIIRPDRYVDAVADDQATLDQLTTDLFAAMGISAATP